MMILQFLPIQTAFAQASRITGKGSETVATSGAAVGDFFNTFWDKLDNWIAALIVVGISIYLANLFRKIAVDKIAEHVDEEHQDLLILAGRATYVVVFGLGITIALKVVGIDVTSIVAAFGLGVGFAMKDLIMNFLAGILLMIARNYTIGDYIQVNNTFGQIVEIQGRATILRLLDGTKAIIPNAELFTSQVISFTSNPFRRFDINVGVEYEADLKKVVEIGKKVLEENKNIVQEPKPAVLVSEFGESSINLVLRFWVDSRSNWWEIRSQTMM
ncbi:mechanosensitive ion channel family protein, partial [Candidatus Peregrinibacteria bacterium]|nr:mechanosensitive ion channel family protein [Candidatus Peregrinibacteria bacterium]